METALNNDVNKKVIFENLPKDELVKKCYHLLSIAQKAKQAKTVLQEENNRLKQQSSVDEATQEMIENLTQQKLSLVTKLDNVNVQNDKLLSRLQICENELADYQYKYNNCDSENVSYKRQITRLTDENEQLLTQMENLEKQIQKLNDIGVLQQKQLLELEESNARKLDEENTCADLQRMLSVSLEEVKRLKSDNISLTNIIENLQISISEKDKNIVIIGQDVMSKDEDIKALTNTNCKLREKVKLYHSKIVKLASSIRSLKDDRNHILNLFKSYNDQVKEWKEKLYIGQMKLVAHVSITENENETLKQKLSKLQDNDNEESAYKNQIINLENTIESHLNELKLLSHEVEMLRNENTNFTSRNAMLNAKFKESEDNLLKAKQESENYIGKFQEMENLYQKLQDELKMIRNENNEYIRQCDNLKKEMNSYEELANRSSVEIRNLAEENKTLNKSIEILEEKLLQLQSKTFANEESQTEGDLANIAEDSDDLIQNLKRENTELLTEMNEMNQAIKERGETISKLEAHCEEVLKKLQLHETQANRNIDSITEKEKIIEQMAKEIDSLKLQQNGNKDAVEMEALKAEVELLKEKLNANLESSYADNETMSTSTISRCDELSRLKDLEGSWEERYGKLRNLAIKLKGKIRELNNALSDRQCENEELQKKLAATMKTVQNLQGQCDRLEDELETTKREYSQQLNKLNVDQQALLSKEQVIEDLKRETESLRKDKVGTENWKKQVSAKVQSLRKELEANNVLRKEFESQIAKLTLDLEAKEKSLKAEIENHKQTKIQLDQSNNECKKQSLLSLEMLDFERSVKETSKKLEKHQEQIMTLTGQVESQKTTINALREQNKLLEDRISDGESTITALNIEIGTYKKQIARLEEEIREKDDKLHSLTQLLETRRLESEELSTELSKVIAEHQKTNISLRGERDTLRSRNLGLEHSLREAEDELKLKVEELKVVKGEYDGYKVRAQSVLRQNQNRDVGLEEKLAEEVASLMAQNATLHSQLDENKQRTEQLEASRDQLIAEVATHLARIKELDGEIVELKNQYAQLVSNHEKTIIANTETVRSLKVHADTLSQCYRQQIAEQESRHNREIIELQSRLEKAPSPTETSLVLPTMPREEGEGSESIESTNNGSQVRPPVPLERLLSSDFDHERCTHLEKLLSEQEIKLGHLTALLSDTEQDLARHVQMNGLLKEEIRRQQRSEERERHAENLEYLKNVVFKFVTLNSGDERTRLVPVLNTILKLSPDENRQLNAVARGETSLKGWTNLLTNWSSPGKPQ